MLVSQVIKRKIMLDCLKCPALNSTTTHRPLYLSYRWILMGIAWEQADWWTHQKWGRDQNSSALPPLPTDLVLIPFLIPFHKQELPKYHPQQQKSWNLPQPLSTQCLVKSLPYSLFHSTNAGAVAGQTKPQNLKNSWSPSGKF